MLTETPFILILNSFTLALAMSFLLIVLWADIKQNLSRFFAAFLIFVQLWNLGMLLQQILPLIVTSQEFVVVSDLLRQSGLIGAAISLYAVMTTLIGIQPRYFGLFVFLYLAAGVGFTVFSSGNTEGSFNSRQFFTFFFSICFNSLTIYSTWNSRRKVSSPAIIAGVILFILGNCLSFLNSTSILVYLAPTFSSIGCAVLSFAIIQRLLITPLTERGNQLESMHEVSMAITSSIVATNEVLSEIAERAARWLGADAAGVFLSRSNQMQLVAVHQLPLSWVACSVEKQDSLVNHVVQSKTAIYLENYARDWHGSDDLPLAKLAYGSVICVPLVYGHKVIGALMVIAGRKGRLFDRSDADLLELLASQAAVAISYRELFSEQRMLTNQLKIAHDQLRTVLSSTDSPVIAIDRNLKLIFTNPAAETLFRLNTLQEKISVTDVIPPVALPLDRREAISHLMQSRTYQYEFDFDGRTFLCHVATLGEQRIEGFVAVLNDISQFKELDRLKSEMVRMTSHDLKNPLQAAMANVELLKDDLTDNQHDEALLSANVIEKQLYKMNRIISGILDLERVRLGSKPTLLCEPAAIIERAVSELVDYATDQKVTIESSIAPDTGKFVGDQEQFIRAIGNLIENAIKFNHADGKVSIEVTKQIDRIVFSVCDTGIGIPQNLHDRIFDRFFRGHQSGAEHISGSGLGLSLVKSVADSHNGQLWFKSTPGQGTIFYLSVPVATNPGVEST